MKLKNAVNWKAVGPMLAVLFIIIVSGIWFFVSGSAYVLKGVLEKGAETRKDAGVYVDGFKSGYVKDVSGNIVDIRITDKGAIDKMFFGIAVYERKDGGIEINSSGIEAGAARIPSGATVQVRSGGIITKIMNYSAAANLLAIIIGLVCIAVFIWMFKKAASLMIMLGVAGGSLLLAFLFSDLLVPLAGRLSSSISADCLPNPTVLAFLITWVVLFFSGMFVMNSLKFWKT